MKKDSTFGIVLVVLVLFFLSKSKTANLQQNQFAATANPGTLTRNPLDGQLYYYFDPTAYGRDPASDSLYGTPTVSSSASTEWNVAAGDGVNAGDPNLIMDLPSGTPVKWQF